MYLPVGVTLTESLWVTVWLGCTFYAGCGGLNVSTDAFQITDPFQVAQFHYQANYYYPAFDICDNSSLNKL